MTISLFRIGRTSHRPRNLIRYRFEHTEYDKDLREKETKMGINRMKLLLGMDFEGEVNRTEIDTYRMGSVRPFASYLNFSGIDLYNRSNDENRCKQLYWTPYEDAGAVNALVREQLRQNGRFYPPYQEGVPPEYRLEESNNQIVQPDRMQRNFEASPSQTYMFVGLLGTAFMLLYHKYGRSNKRHEYKE